MDTEKRYMSKQGKQLVILHLPGTKQDTHMYAHTFFSSLSNPGRIVSKSRKVVLFDRNKRDRVRLTVVRPEKFVPPGTLYLILMFSSSTLEKITLISPSSRVNSDRFVKILEILSTRYSLVGILPSLIC